MKEPVLSKDITTFSNKRAVMKNDPAKTVFNILGFQYKPMEKKVLAQLKAYGRQDLIEKYKKLSYARKIHVLDGMARKFYGL